MTSSLHRPFLRVRSISQLSDLFLTVYGLLDLLGVFEIDPGFRS